LVDLSRCKAISIEDINIQQEGAGTQKNTVSKTATQRVKHKENKSIFNGGDIIIPTGLR